MLSTFEKQFPSENASEVARILADKLSGMHLVTLLQSVIHANDALLINIILIGIFELAI